MKLSNEKVRDLILDEGLTPRRVELLTAGARTRKRSMEQTAINQGYDPDVVAALRDRWGISHRRAQA